MNAVEFLRIVEEVRGIDREPAERATRATLRTLAEHIAPGEARQVAAQLPPEMAP